MTTNGTLFTEEAKRWFEKYKDVFWVGTSYDGTPEMQEKNRGQLRRHLWMILTIGRLRTKIWKMDL